MGRKLRRLGGRRCRFNYSRGTFGHRKDTDTKCEFRTKGSWFDGHKRFNQG